MKNLIILISFIGVVTNVQAQLTESEGTLRISDGTPTIQLFDDASAENRLEGILGESADDISLRSLIGDLILDGETEIIFRKNGSTIMRAGRTDHQFLVLRGDDYSTITDSHLLLLRGDDIDVSTALRFENGREYASINFLTNPSSGLFTPNEEQINFVINNEVVPLRLRNLESGSDLVEVDGEIIPRIASNGYDIGNNNIDEHWDDVVADDFVNFSDKRLKKNISELGSHELDRIKLLHPVTYEYIESHNNDGRKRTGFLA